MSSSVGIQFKDTRFPLKYYGLHLQYTLHKCKHFTFIMFTAKSKVFSLCNIVLNCHNIEM